MKERAKIKEQDDSRFMNEQALKLTELIHDL